MSVCEKCGKSFKNLNQHKKRKTPCVSVNVIETLNKIKSYYEYKLPPLVKWSGGKKDEIKKFIKYIPKKFDTYFEPFFGGGAVYFYICPKKAVVCDVHKELIKFYQSIKDGRSTDIIKFMDENKNDSDTYYKVRKNKPKSDIEVAQRFYYLRKTCYRGMLRYNKKGEFNIPYGKYKTMNYDILKNDKYKNILQNTKILLKNFEDIFNNDEYDSEDNFMFLDPPYDSKFTDYGYCSFTKEHHKKLADCFKKTKIKCLMIIGKTDFISELYKDYIVDEYDKKYRFKIHSNRVGSEINTKHLIICNYKIN
jgi:DNA adenine methylase